MDGKMNIGISTCLLGERVRYDGNHKLDRFLTDTLGEYVQYVPVCPEVECGFPTPRESFRLVGNPDSPRLVTTKTGLDHTEKMLNWSRERVARLENEDLCGFIFKSRSPSSGMRQIKVYDDKGVPRKTGTGIFARAFMEHFPLIPVEDDGRLHDPRIRENFIERIFTLMRWREAVSKKMSRGTLVEFHTRHKLLLLSHSHKHYRTMGKLVARAKEVPLAELYSKYQQLLMDAMKLMTTNRKNANVLQHIMGYFKKVLTKDEKQELLEIIQLYRDGTYPLIVPITLVNHYVRKYDEAYLKIQYYLNPHPLELQLRNHV
ncbi:MAG: DUF1722 domain-containing protein [Deltaproteobacteria bacterium]|nr:DUF1722 domain-containing protein [Deltaproteobacteria bacterium]